MNNSKNICIPIPISSISKPMTITMYMPTPISKPIHTSIPTYVPPVYVQPIQQLPIQQTNTIVSPPTFASKVKQSLKM